MKPSARLRMSPRSDSLALASREPWTSTSPDVGASSPPSRCRSVLLPEPDAPTIATRSPGCTAKSTPVSTATSRGPLRYVLHSARASITGTEPGVAAARTVALSLIAQRFRGPDPGRAQAWIHGGEQREHERHERNGGDIAALKVRRKLADVVDA